MSRVKVIIWLIFSKNDISIWHRWNFSERSFLFWMRPNKTDMCILKYPDMCILKYGHFGAQIKMAAILKLNAGCKSVRVHMSTFRQNIFWSHVHGSFKESEVWRTWRHKALDKILLLRKCLISYYRCKIKWVFVD